MAIRGGFLRREQPQNFVRSRTLHDKTSVKNLIAVTAAVVAARIVVAVSAAVKVVAIVEVVIAAAVKVVVVVEVVIAAVAVGVSAPLKIGRVVTQQPFED